MVQMIESMNDMYTFKECESRKEVGVQDEQLQWLEREIQASKKKVAEQQQSILYLESQVQPRRKTRVNACKSVPLSREKQSGTNPWVRSARSPWRRSSSRSLAQRSLF
ncbi:hypothetical protein GUJ93_ZPchr0013g35742 [Zizania palustris]|uniref:Uncharacterized protein n=1 Tax=Zizania palustris TaxID=103762 RepID=A0A8J5WUZ1_ZIZPA|nr:hypothetical protein GUJ93_ZPchr0013g35742 [Zizania palustris]